MLDLRYVVDNLDAVRAGLLRRGGEPPGFERIVALAASRKQAIVEGEGRKRAVNEASAAIARLPKGSPEQAEARERSRALGDEAKQWDTKQKEIETELEDLLLFGGAGAAALGVGG